MIRARFNIDKKTHEPTLWPIKHPYWCVGFGPKYAIMIAYADSREDLLAYWPDAWNITFNEASDYIFSEYTPKPDWLKS